MRKFSLILVIFVLTASAWARVDVTVEPNGTDPCSFNIVYNVTGDDADEGVRAFALDIFVHSDVNIVEVNDFHAGESTSTAKGYGIFPSNFASDIDPEDPEWDNENYTPLGNEADYPDDTLGGLDTNGITVELGSLYEDPNEPDDSGILLEIVVGSQDFVEISLALNQIRGGIVLEDSNEPDDVNLVGYSCLVGGNAGPLEYSDWVSWSRPACWCYCRQCRGDVDGKATFGQWVAIGDLAVLYAAYNKPDAVLATIPNGICADFDHKKTFGIRVTISDLGIAYSYFGKPVGSIPRCDTAPVITGPYNFWVVPPGSSCP